jgi:hypothetical protein
MDWIGLDLYEYLSAICRPCSLAIYLSVCHGCDGYLACLMLRRISSAVSGIV